MSKISILVACSILLLTLLCGVGTAADSFESWSKKGSTAFTQQNYPEAISSFKQALKLKPNHVGLLNNLALAYGASEQNDKSIMISEQVLKIQPNEEGALFSLGIIYYRNLNNPDKAVEYWNQIVKVSKNENAVALAKRMIAVAQM